MDQFWVKYLFRVAHIGSMIAISHKTISDFQAGSISPDGAIFYMIMGIITIVSGFVNTFILQPKKMGEKRKPWVGFHHLKLLLTIILYLPFAKWIMSSSTLASARMYWILLIILISPFMRFYREFHSNNMQKNRI